MKKRFLIILFLCFLLLPSIAQTLDSTSFINSLSFALGGQVNVRVGHQGEYVYEPVANDRLLSYLEWDEKPVVIVGLFGEAGYKNLKLQVQGKLAFPADSGTMEDSDYLNIYSFPHCPDSIASILTNYTTSICHTEALRSIEFQLSYDFILNPVITLSPLLGYEYQYSYQTAWGLDGYYYNTELYVESNGYYGSYDTYGHNVKKFHSEDENTLSLERNYHTVWLGLGASFNLNKKIKLDAMAAISPFIAIQSLDCHLLTGYKYLDDMHSWFKGGKISVKLDYFINTHNCLYGQVKFSSTGIANGITYHSVISGTEFHKSPNSHAGGDLQAWDFTLGYTYYF